MRVDRLLKLADLLDTVPPQQFDMGKWSDSTEFTCNTVACAGGWACSIPEFEKDGLFLTTDEWGYLVCFGKKSATAALMAFFESKEDVINSTFYSETYHASTITPTMVAARIREKVREYAPDTATRPAF